MKYALLLMVFLANVANAAKIENDSLTKLCSANNSKTITVIDFDYFEDYMNMNVEGVINCKSKKFSMYYITTVFNNKSAYKRCSHLAEVERQNSTMRNIVNLENCLSKDAVERKIKIKPQHVSTNDNGDLIVTLKNAPIGVDVNKKDINGVFVKAKEIKLTTNIATYEYDGELSFDGRPSVSFDIKGKDFYAAIAKAYPERISDIKREMNEADLESLIKEDRTIYGSIYLLAFSKNIKYDEEYNNFSVVTRDAEAQDIVNFILKSYKK